MDNKDNETPKNPKKDFEKMVELFFEKNKNPVVKQNNYATPVGELEIRFGTKQFKKITKIDYDNVVKQLFSAGFTTSLPNGLHILRIQPEFMNNQGQLTLSNIRAEIPGIDLVQEYCKTNSIQKIIDMHSTLSTNFEKIKFTKKTPPKWKNTEQRVKFVDFDDYNFRVSYQEEEDFTTKSSIAQKIITNWNNSKKSFRYINRVRFSHPLFPVFADVSIVRSSKFKGKVPFLEYSIQDAGVLSNPETYEIELELNNEKIGENKMCNNLSDLLHSIRKCIRIVLGGLQNTQYPISFSETNAVVKEYLKILHKDNFKQIMQKRNEKRNFKQDIVYSGRDFIGPSSLPLQIENIVSDNQLNVPNVRTHYCVTDKADGERRLLFVDDNGKIYMMDTNMNVMFTGTKTLDKTLHNSIVDGEFIKYNKKNEIINLYAAFDLYFYNKQSAREYGFIPENMEETSGGAKEGVQKYRLPLLYDFVKRLKPQSIVVPENEIHLTKTSEMPSNTAKACHFVVKCKDFYNSNENFTIFDACSEILSKTEEGFEYNTDGIIFTPTNTGVASHKIGTAGALEKVTWELSLKWKPPEYNTIDFLVSMKKDKNGQDEIHNIFQEGTNMQGVQNVSQYKTLELRCGFDPNKHGYLNAFMDVVNGVKPFQKIEDKENTKNYFPVPFQPTNPYDPTAKYCNVSLKNNGNDEYVLLTEENEYFDEGTIVEFKYDTTKNGFWKWVPLRVRYDKTAELNAGLKNYGNAYHVANSNWRSIHNPVTLEMMKTGEGIPTEINNDDVYYNRSNSLSNTKSLRDFHNLFVKKKLIANVSKRNDTLIDYAVGKGGDISKWIASNLSFVFGIDISKDNIQNNLDGACARYLNSCKKNKHVPNALFVCGNSGLNIRDGSSFINQKDKEITHAVFGEGPKDKQLLGEGVYHQYGKAKDGFNVSSIQFALHYFFENKKSFHEMLKNVSECTKVNGYFIGTCYDGKKVFELLKNIKINESITMFKEECKIFEITKKYEQTDFYDDETSLGYSIDIFQETINKVFREYLVNYHFLERMLENYGFVVLTNEEAKQLGFPNGSGYFEDLFKFMEQEMNTNHSNEYGTALQMSNDEKKISFMNRYFIFKKKENVNTNNVFKMFLKEYDYQQTIEKVEEIFVNVETTPHSLTKLNVPKVVIQPSQPLLPPLIPIPLDDVDVVDVVDDAKEEALNLNDEVKVVEDKVEPKVIPKKNCPENKEFNPITKRCNNKCKDGYVRNSEFKCVSAKNRKGEKNTSPPPAKIQFMPDDDEVKIILKKIKKKNNDDKK